MKSQKGNVVFTVRITISTRSHETSGRVKLYSEESYGTCRDAFEQLKVKLHGLKFLLLLYELKSSHYSMLDSVGSQTTFTKTFDSFGFTLNDSKPMKP